MNIEKDASKMEVNKAKEAIAKWPTFQATFGHNDGIAGDIGPLSALSVPKEQEFIHGRSIEKTGGPLEFSVDSCQCFQVKFLNPKFEEHSTKLLRGII